MKQGKVWGNTQTIFKNDNFEVHRIEAKKAGYSSEHLHQYKYNGFFVESGKLCIRTWKKDYDLVDETIITTGEFTQVSPGEIHQFEALEDSIAYEIYWSHGIDADIIRCSVGGVKQNL